MIRWLEGELERQRTLNGEMRRAVADLARAFQETLALAHEAASRPRSSVESARRRVMRGTLLPSCAVLVKERGGTQAPVGVEREVRHLPHLDPAEPPVEPERRRAGDGVDRGGVPAGSADSQRERAGGGGGRGDVRREEGGAQSSLRAGAVRRRRGHDGKGLSAAQNFAGTASAWLRRRR